MFDLKVLSRERRIYEDEADRVQVQGAESDYELLSFHADCAGLLRAGRIIIDGQYQVRILKGMVSFHNNRCVILVEEDKRRLRRKKK